KPRCRRKLDPDAVSPCQCRKTWRLGRRPHRTVIQQPMGLDRDLDRQHALELQRAGHGLGTLESDAGGPGSTGKQATRENKILAKTRLVRWRAWRMRGRCGVRLRQR